jgi:hypothetical protein
MGNLEIICIFANKKLIKNMTIDLKSDMPLPTGRQDFQSIRRDGCVYIDKTDLIYRLTQTSKYVFLNRPRRFGKSLLCSTLKYYFQGRRDLFAGLAIERLEKQWTEYPVIYLYMNETKYVPVNKIEKVILLALKDYEKIYGECTSSDLGRRFKELIRNAYEKTGNRVVVIIDEYNAPLLHRWKDAEALRIIREILQRLYAPLKDADPYLRFCFITGPTTFSQLSVFRTTDNLKNISCQERYASICGVTERELHQYLQPNVEALSQKLQCSLEAGFAKLKEYYGRFHFTPNAEEVYHPASVMSALNMRCLKPYAFEWGTPSYLVPALRLCTTDLTQWAYVEAMQSQFDGPTETMDSVLPLLYQNGLLSILDYDLDMDICTLGIPNKETQIGWKCCLSSCLQVGKEKPCWPM